MREEEEEGGGRRKKEVKEVCDCGISWPYSLGFFLCELQMFPKKSSKIKQRRTKKTIVVNGSCI